MERSFAYFHTTVDALTQGVQSMVISLAQKEKLQIQFEIVEGRFTISDDLPDIEILEIAQVAANYETLKRKENVETSR